MNNYEKIKNMSIDEMAEFMTTADFSYKVFKLSGHFDDFKQWLESEEE